MAILLTVLMRIRIRHWFSIFRFSIVVATCAISSAMAQPSPNSDHVRIVALGSSNTEGKIVSGDQAYPAQLERQLQAQGFNVAVSNQGVSGDTTTDQRRRLETAIPDGTQIVLFQPGTNDCGRRGIGKNQMEENISAMLSRMKEKHLEVLVLGGGCYEELQASLPLKYGFTYYGKMAQGLKDFSRPDGQHFTADGYSRMAELLLPSVKMLIQNVLAGKK